MKMLSLRVMELVDSYKGITVTSVLAKVLETLVCDRMDMTLHEAGIPIGAMWVVLKCYLLRKKSWLAMCRRRGHLCTCVRMIYRKHMTVGSFLFC